MQGTIVRCSCIFSDGGLRKLRNMDIGSRRIVVLRCYRRRCVRFMDRVIRRLGAIKERHISERQVKEEMNGTHISTVLGLYTRTTRYSVVSLRSCGSWPKGFEPVPRKHKVSFD